MDITLRDFVIDVLREDMGRGDLFAQCTAGKESHAEIRAKESGVLAGETYVKTLATVADVKTVFHIHDGDHVEKGDVICSVAGLNTTLLGVERTMLNMLQHASGIATNASRYALLLRDSGIKLLDTRKTRPLLRNFEKYAARCGGVVNHRLGLDDALMLKDTHLKTIDNLAHFMENARKRIPFTAKIEIECETVEMAVTALTVGADIIMCDNMELEEIIQVVSQRDRISPGTLIEVSGNITDATISGYKGIGIDAISSGSIIHQARWLDFSMKML